MGGNGAGKLGEFRNSAGHAFFSPFSKASSP
jgi:hypothetical protein